MKRLIGAAVAATLLAAPAQADLVHRIQTSVQLSVDAAASNATRVPSVYSVSGTNVDVTDGTTSGNVGGLASYSAGTAVGFTGTTGSVKVAGEDFSFSESFIEGDKPHTGSSVSSGVIGTLPAFGNTVTSAGGVAGSLAGTVGNDGSITITAGGAGTRSVRLGSDYFKLICVRSLFTVKTASKASNARILNTSLMQQKTLALHCPIHVEQVLAAAVLQRSLQVKSTKAIKAF